MQNTKGFTLIELVIVITVVGIISGIVGFILVGTIDAWTFKFNRSDILSDARLAMGRMTREVREIKNLTSVTIADSSQFRFVNIGDLDIAYSLSGSNLTITENSDTNLLAENVSSLTFIYYDANGDTILAPAVSPSSTDIRRVRINLTLTKNGENVYLQSESVPRNF